MSWRSGIPRYQSFAILTLLGLLEVTPSPASSVFEGDCPIVQDGLQVSPAFALLRDATEPFVYQKGDSIHVKLVLTGRRRGVYLPAYFGDFQKTCRFGFATSIMTYEGKVADPSALGCIGSDMGEPETKYIRLRRGRSRSWETTLPTASITPGRYCLYAEYLESDHAPNVHTTKDEAIMPGTAGKVLQGRRFTATPIPIEIR